MSNTRYHKKDNILQLIDWSLTNRMCTGRQVRGVGGLGTTIYILSNFERGSVRFAFDASLVRTGLIWIGIAIGRCATPIRPLAVSLQVGDAGNSVRVDLEYHSVEGDRKTIIAR